VTLKHRIAHWFGWYHGYVESFWLHGTLWCGYRCSTCNEINMAQKTATRIADEDEFRRLESHEIRDRDSEQINKI